MNSKELERYQRLRAGYLPYNYIGQLSYDAFEWRHHLTFGHDDINRLFDGIARIKKDTYRNNRPLKKFISYMDGVIRELITTIYMNCDSDGRAKGSL